MVILAGAAGYAYYRQSLQEPPPTTINPEYRDIEEVLEVSGTIEASNSARLSFPAAAKLTWVGVKEGDLVKQWQGVAKVDTATLQKQMAIDQNLHGKQFRGFEETLDDNDYFGGSGLTESERRTVESAQLDLRNTALTAEIREIAIRNSYLTAPIAGIVTRVDRPVANLYILPTDVFEIVDPTSLYFKVAVDEEDVGEIKIGQTVKVNLDAYPEESRTGQVNQIAFAPTSTAEGSLGYAVKIGLPLDNQSLNYKLGMNGDGQIILAQKPQVLAIPVDSLITRDDKTYVEVMAGETKAEREITTGIESEEWIEVVSGLAVTDAVVVPESE